MEFMPSELIRKKRHGQAHSREEIRFLIRGYAENRIPDYQISAWLMAICFQGMTLDETSWLTQEMRDSGVVLDLKKLGRTVDKHSTGGVGDKTSLLVAPLVAAAGVPVPMMAGRGLGHTGGTLDKLESIKGFSVHLGFEQFQKQVESVGAAIIGQSREICPADKKLYALRDVTGTIDSLPLICGSILSKKLAEGMSALVLDVKFGSGAFMKTVEQAEALARILIDVGARFDRKIVALITRMDEPLGRFIGNALEVRECLDILASRLGAKLEGKGYEDTLELTLELAGHMIHLGGKSRDANDGKRIAAELMASGAARAKFDEICRRQGGDLSAPLPAAPYEFTVKAPRGGFFNYVDLEKLGLAAVLLGAGRKFTDDRLDLAAGIEAFRRQGAPVKEGDALFTLYAADEARAHSAMTLLLESFEISGKAAAPSPLIAKVVE